jgi:uncharacterized protein YjiS (DUF1127 family)
MHPTPIYFHVPLSYVGNVDKINGVVHGVSLITGGIKARGHDLYVDDITLQQLFECAQRMGQVPVKWNHKTGADAVNGFVTNFWIDGNKVRGDWHLLKEHSQYKQALELADRMPQNIGLSAAFVPPERLAPGDNGKARCEELVSVDLVAQPAANPDGLLDDPRFRQIQATDPAFADFVIRFFEESMDRPPSGVDTRRNGMAEKTNNPPAGDAQPTLADLHALILQQNATITALQQQMAQSQQQASEPTLADLADMSDEQLIDMGLDPGKVDAAIQSAIQSGELTVDNGAPGGAGEARSAQPGEGGDANAAAAAAGTVGAELAALRKEIEYFKAKERREIHLAERQEETRLLEAFEVVEKKCVELAARNDALEAALESGAGKPVSAGAEIQLDAGGKPVKFEEIVNTEFQRLMKGKGRDGKPMTELEAKSKAIDFGVRRHTAAYREFRSSGRGQIEFSVPAQ